MFCEKCGKELPANSKFCTACGAPVKVADATSSTATSDTLKDVSNFVGKTANEIVSSSIFKEKDILALTGLGACAGLILSTLFPFATVSIFGYKESASLISGGDGILFIIIALVAAALICLKKHLFTLIVSVINFCIMLISVISLNKQIGNDWGSDLIHKGVGFYLLIIASIVLVVCTGLQFKKHLNA